MLNRSFVILAGLLVAACSEPEGPTITFERGGIIPESIEYDQINGWFLSGSFTKGTVFQIHKDGHLVPMVTDAELPSTVGLEVDEPRRRLLVVSSDDSAFRGNTGYAKLGVFELTTGSRIALVDLAAALDAPPTNPPRYFANDVAVDGDGNAYVTDTLNNLVYKVTMDYHASVLHVMPSFRGENLLNGIVYHEDGYLLLSGGKQLFKMPLENPSAVSEVAIDDPIGSQDGMVWAADGRLVSVSNSTWSPQAAAFTSDDGWASARRVGTARLSGQATAAATAGNEIWVVHPHFSDADPPSLELAVFH